MQPGPVRRAVGSAQRSGVPSTTETGPGQLLLKAFGDHQFYANATGLFTELTQRWIREGTLAEGSDPHALPSLFVTLMPGMIVMSHLYELPAAESLAQGMVDLASAMGSRSGPQPRHG
jgi:hypothetical protein